MALPLNVYLGLGGLLFLTLAVITGALALKGKAKIGWHKLFAVIAFLIALVHGFLVMRNFF